MKLEYKHHSIDVKIKDPDYIKLGEKSRAFRKLYKFLKMPSASISCDSYCGGDVLIISLNEEITEEQEKKLDNLRFFFQNTEYDGIIDYHYYNKNPNPFAFNFVHISYFKGE